MTRRLALLLVVAMAAAASVGVPARGSRDRSLGGQGAGDRRLGASTFGHDETLVVVGSPDDVGLGQRVRDLLGVGSVSVSVGSGIAPVTVVVGRDFTG